MDSTPDVDDELVVKALAELADADYQTQVWAGRVPAVGSSLIACYASLFGESGGRPRVVRAARCS
jgi:muramidase (phage lysozyme)